jgi:hypothetical protein
MKFGRRTMTSENGGRQPSAAAMASARKIRSAMRSAGMSW